MNSEFGIESLSLLLLDKLHPHFIHLVHLRDEEMEFVIFESDHGIATELLNTSQVVEERFLLNLIIAISRVN